MKLATLFEKAAQTFIVKKYDGIIPTGNTYYDPMDVEVSFADEPDDHFDHEFGREKIRGDVWVTGLTLVNDVKECDADTEKVVKVWKKGTDVTDLPGWDESNVKFFQSKVEKK